VTGLPDLPAGSAIRAEARAYDVRLSWRGRPDRLAVRGAKAGLVGVVVPWGASVLYLIVRFTERDSGPEAVRAARDLGMIVGVVVAAICSLILAAALYCYIRLSRPRPESLVLGVDGITHSEGGRAFERDPLDPRAWVRPAHWASRALTLLRRPRRTRATKADVLDVRLAGGERYANRLTLTLRGERVPVGASLRDADRAWLFEVLRRWKGEEAGA
jgi:hypothetical protein